MNNILILGPIGSGKTTQSRQLADYLGIPLLVAGDFLYYASKGTGRDSKEIAEKMKKGEIVDDETTLSLIEEHLECGKEHAKGTVLDGFPRNIRQAERFSFPINKVIYLKVSDKEVVRRLLSRGRGDDTPEIIQKRLSIYHQETEPLLKYYRSQGILEEVDGERGIEQIFEEVKKLFKL